MRWGRLRSGLFGFWLRFGSVTGRNGHAPSLSLAKTPKILAPHGYNISSNALIIGGLFHGILEALEVGHFRGWNRLPPIVKYFWNPPFPMFDMAVGKRKVRALIVTACRHVPPDVLLINGADGRITKLRIQLRVLVLVNEDKKVTRYGLADISEFVPSREGWISRWHTLRVAVHRLAQIVTPPT